jgi:beta-galactosidase
MNHPLKDRIPYGTTYSPLAFEEAFWERDLELISEAGMNLVRVGDIGTWEQVEVHEGETLLDRLQRFYTLANKYNLQVLLSTGTASPPLWLAMKYPDVAIRSNRREDYPLGASYHWACIHHPGYLAACERYIAKLAAFAMRQPNHFGWQISNEIGFPFNPTRESNDVDLYCYCTHSRNAFIEWLKKKYASLEDLTKAWAWSTTNYNYTAWEQAFPPEALPKSWASVTRWIDWRLFWQQAFADHAGWQHELIRRQDADHPTSVNTFNFKSYDRFGTYTGLDQWKISKKVDTIGYDLYPGSGDKLAARPEHNSIFLDHGRSVCQAAQSDLWLHEIESGPIGGWLLGPDHNTDAKDILTMCFEALGHNGKLLAFMPWREWEFQPLHWGALVDLRSRPTPRYDSAALVGEYIRRNSPFLSEARVPRGEVAILESKPNAIFLRGVGQEDELFDAQRGAYRGFWEQGYRVDFITPGQLSDPALNNYKFICLPLMGLITREMGQALLAYVEGGGVLVGFARLGTLDERGWYQPDLPIPEFGKAFGINRVHADTLNNQKILLEGETYDGWLNRDILVLEKGTEVLASFLDGYPAVTCAKVSLGYGVYIATQADGGLAKAGNTLLQDVIIRVSARLGLRPQLRLDYPQKSGREIDAHLLDTPWRTEIILVSYLGQPAEVSLQLAEPDRTALGVKSGLLEKLPLEFIERGGNLHFSLSIEARQVTSIEIEWGRDADGSRTGKEGAQKR